MLLENLISTYTERWVTVLGIIYVLVALLAPNGLAGLIVDSRKERTGA